jgi:uncharacterized membrane protein
MRNELTKLAREQHDLVLRDVAVAVYYPDGCFTLNGEQFYIGVKTHVGIVAHLLSCLALGAPPLTGQAVGAAFAITGTVEAAGISTTFIQEVKDLIKPGTSALFVLDEVGNMDAILKGIRGLGGTILKTSVDLERATLIQSALSASADAADRETPGRFRGAGL